MSQLRVELPVGVRAELGEMDERVVSQRRAEEALDVETVGGERRRLGLVAREPLVQEVPQRHAGAHRRLFAHLLAELVPQLDRAALGIGRSRRHDLLAGDRVTADEHPYLERAAVLPDAGEVHRRASPRGRDQQLSPDGLDRKLDRSA
jgi:hypothetical protein